MAARQHQQPQHSQPSNSTTAQHQQQHIARAPSGESPSGSYHSSARSDDGQAPLIGDDEEETGKCAISSPCILDSLSYAGTTDDTWGFQFDYTSPLFAQSALPQQTNNQLPLHPFSPTFTTPSNSASASASVPALNQKLHAHLPLILSKSNLPAEYHTLTIQLLDLLAYKAALNTSPSNTCLNAEQEIAQRARKIDEALTRLNNRNAFDTSFESMTGFEFNPIAFLTASNLSPPTNTSSVYSNSPLDYSPMGMSSPDLIYETFSQFSGSSAPTSPAAPMLAMTASPAMLSSSSGIGSPL
jgi:hypothetical protein